MTESTEHMEVNRISSQKLRSFAAAILHEQGVPQEDAAFVAEVLVEADLRGVDSHGVTRLSGYVSMIHKGVLNPRPAIRVVHDSGATAALDGDHGFGMLGARLGMATAIEKARQFGVAIVTARNLSHTGMVGFYTMSAASQDMIGIAMNNGAGIVPPFGGLTPTHGTNPFSVAFPTESDPVVLDMATTMVAAGKLRLAAKKGTPIPLDWGLDRHGEPTSDPNEVLAHGVLQWAGGYKGFGIATAVEVLGGVLSGGLFARDVPQLKVFGQDPIIANGAYIAVDIQRFMPLTEFRQRMTSLVDQIKSSEPAPGVERVYVAGEPEFMLKEQRTREGIPLSAEVYQELFELSKEYSMPFDIIQHGREP